MSRFKPKLVGTGKIPLVGQNKDADNAEFLEFVPVHLGDLMVISTVCAFAAETCEAAAVMTDAKAKSEDINLQIVALRLNELAMMATTLIGMAPADVVQKVMADLRRHADNAPIAVGTEKSDEPS